MASRGAGTLRFQCAPFCLVLLHEADELPAEIWRCLWALEARKTVGRPDDRRTL